MNFKKLPKEKRQQLVVLLIATVAVVDALTYGVPGLPGLMRHQQERCARLDEAQKGARSKLTQMQTAIKRTQDIATDLTAAKKELVESESDVASGDLYSWVINTLRTFKANYKVEIPAFQPIGPTMEVDVLPLFPYKQATLAVSGTAHFHDFGKFLADLENKFPHVRVINLGVELNLNPSAEDKETVGFRMDFVTLVKANNS
jgi:hypothetical protein